MSKTATIQTRMEPGLKAKVEAILSKLGLSPSEAITLYYSQIALKKGLPFAVEIPNQATRKAMQDVRAKRNLKHAQDTDDL